MEVCGDSTSDHSTILSWSQRVHQGQDNTEDMEHSSRLKTDNISAAIVVTILEDRQTYDWEL